MTCTHQFILIEQLNRPMGGFDNASSTTPDAIAPNRDMYGSKVGCIVCGEIRTIWADGEITIDVPAKDEQKENNKE